MYRPGLGIVIVFVGYVHYRGDDVGGDLREKEEEEEGEEGEEEEEGDGEMEEEEGEGEKEEEEKEEEGVVAGIIPQHAKKYRN